MPVSNGSPSKKRKVGKDEGPVEHKQEDQAEQQQQQQPVVMVFDSSSSKKDTEMVAAVAAVPESETQIDINAAIRWIQLSIGHAKIYMPMPVSMDNSLLNQLEEFDGDLWIAGKNDGERVFMSIQKKQVCFTPRSTFEPELCQGGAQILRNYAEMNGDCLIDGEWSSKEKLFVAHDLVSVNGRPIIDLPFRDRREQLLTLIERLQQRLRVVNADFQLACKTFVPFENFEKDLLPLLLEQKPEDKQESNNNNNGVTAMNDDKSSSSSGNSSSSDDDDDDDQHVDADAVKSCNNHRRWMFVQAQKRRICVPVDGLIIATGKAIYAPTDNDATSLIKIKFISTIDFLISGCCSVGDKKEAAFQLMAGTGNHHQSYHVDCAVLWRQDVRRQKMLDYILDCLQNHNTRPVVECWYDRSISRFVALRVRKDKKLPNHYKTVLKTVLMVADDIKLDGITRCSKRFAETRRIRTQGG